MFSVFGKIGKFILALKPSKTLRINVSLGDVREQQVR